MYLNIDFTLVLVYLSIQQGYTLRKGIFGKDLGKRGTPLGDKEM